MKLVVQRSLESSVSVNNKIVGSIEKGMVVLVSFTHTDTVDDINYLVNKLIKLRIFDDENSIMNKSLLDIDGEILSISQFTLYANTTKGNRPSYIEAMNSDKALMLYNMWNDQLRKMGIRVETGIFGANMQLNIINDGPITIILESRKNYDKKQKNRL